MLSMLSEKMKWAIVSSAAAMVTGAITQSLLRRGYEAVMDDDPPYNPASPRVTWPKAIVWALGAGALVSLAQMSSEAGAAKAWRARHGRYPRALRRNRS